MGMGKDLMEFFHPERITSTATPITLGHFIDQFPDYAPATKILSGINKLILESHLVLIDHSWDFNLRNNRYQSFGYNREFGNYGVYDFAIYGFPFVYSEFSDSVIPIITQKIDHGIGTGFLVSYAGNPCLITAKHCIVKAGKISIFDASNKIANPITVISRKRRILLMTIFHTPIWILP